MLTESRIRFATGVALVAAQCCVAGLLAAESGTEHQIEAGMRLRDAVDVLESQGLRIFYSTDLVRARMRLVSAPAAALPADILAEILVPFGLAVQAGPDDALVIVRGERNTPGPALGGALSSAAAAGEPQAPSPPRLEEIIVAASRYRLGRDVGTSQSVLTRSEIDYAPEMGDDALRPVARLPGMASNGVSSRSNVRGGEIGETLVRFDGLRLYDPFHLRDFQSVFSTLDPRVVSSINVYTGAFPAAFGDRMSSVVDVASMAPPADRYHEVGLSFFNSSLLSAGRFSEGKGEWVTSARRSNLDLLYDAFSEQPERPKYIDTFAKLGYQINERLRISGNVLYSRDDISLSEDIDREERAHANHSDAYFWLRLDHDLDAEFSGRTLLARSTLDSNRHGTSAKNGISHGSLSDRKSFSIQSLQSDWTKNISDTLLVQFGATVDHVSGRYDYADEVLFDLLFDFPGAPDDTARTRSITAMPSGRQIGAYSSLRLSPTQRFTLDLGIRWDKQHIDSLNSSTLSPRIGIRYQLASRTNLRASWGRFSQSQTINEMQVSDGVEEYFNPQRADQAVIGIEHTFGNGIGLRIEAYQKSMDHLRPRHQNLLNSLILLPELKPDRVTIAPQSAMARGFEVMLDQSTGKPLRWWANYSYSWVKDRLNGQEVLRSWDQTHALSGGIGWETSNWVISAALSHRTGWPTSIASLDQTRAYPTAVVSSHNVARLGRYRSLDLNVTRVLQFEDSELSITFELVNVFDRSNPCCVEYEIGDEDEAGLLLFKTLDYLPRVPSIGFIWKF